MIDSILCEVAFIGTYGHAFLKSKQNGIYRGQEVQPGKIITVLNRWGEDKKASAIKRISIPKIL